MKINNRRVEHYLKLARNACYYSDNKRARLGCIFVYRGKVISIGWNLQDKTNPLQKRYNHYRGFDPDASNCHNTIHAECHALLRARDLDINWSKVMAYVYRIKKDGSDGLAKPCPACQAMLIEQGINKVCYTDGFGNWTYEEWTKEG